MKLQSVFKEMLHFPRQTIYTFILLFMLPFVQLDQTTRMDVFYVVEADLCILGTEAIPEFIQVYSQEKIRKAAVAIYVYLPKVTITFKNVISIGLPIELSRSCFRVNMPKFEIRCMNICYCYPSML